MAISSRATSTHPPCQVRTPALWDRDGRANDLWLLSSLRPVFCPHSAFLPLHSLLPHSLFLLYFLHPRPVFPLPSVLLPSCLQRSRRKKLSVLFMFDGADVLVFTPPFPSLLFSFLVFTALSFLFLSFSHEFTSFLVYIKLVPLGATFSFRCEPRPQHLFLAIPSQVGGEGGQGRGR